MMLAKITDACLYFLAAVVVLAVVVGFASEIKKGPSASQQKDHYETISKPIMTATEAAQKHLDEANAALDAESCKVNQCPKVKSKPRVRRLFKRRIFLRWRRR